MARRSKKEEPIYCAFCGAENIKDDTNCKKCKKDLHPKNEPFKDFLYTHIKDDLKGKVEDSIISYLKNFIISHLYGIAMTLSIVFTAIVIIAMPKSSYKVISSVDDINKTKANNDSKEIVATVYTYDDSCYGNMPEEWRDVPFPVAGYIVSGKRMTVKEIKLKKGESIKDWCNNGNKEDIICNEASEEIYLYDKKIEDLAKKYRDTFKSYADWYHKNGTKNEKEYIRRSDEVDTLGYELMREHKLEKYNIEKPINKSIELFIGEIGCAYQED